MKMLNAIRKKLPLLDDVDDGAISRDGTFTYIAKNELQKKTKGFNCSGFAKWIADGFYFPLEGRFMDIGRLKMKHIGYRGTKRTDRYEEERDPFFGLDWTRNIAMVLEEARTGATQSNPEAFDVRHVDYSEYIEDVGYQVAQLDTILYNLAIDYPGCFYLGSVNGDFGKNPVLHEHFHVVVLLPYFDGDGKFHAAVVERNRETSVESLTKTYKGTHIHLVRIDSDGEFKLPLP